MNQASKLADLEQRHDDAAPFLNLKVCEPCIQDTVMVVMVVQALSREESKLIADAINE